MALNPKTRSEARRYLNETLRSLVPDGVIDDVWDNVVAPMYDGVRTVRTSGSDTAGQRPDSSGHLSNHYL